MKRPCIIHACIALSVIMRVPIVSAPARTAMALIEEEESFWNEFLAQEGIANKNLLHASFIVYRERMFDLSIESLRECIARKPKKRVLAHTHREAEEKRQNGKKLLQRERAFVCDISLLEEKAQM